MPRQPCTIDLLPEEQTLFDELILDSEELEDREDHADNGERVVSLFQALRKRGAIPERRIRYFTDPEYNPGGRGRSRQQVFERNGCRGEGILRHAHFLDHFRFMLCGADLPDPARQSFQREVKRCGLVTSGDVVPLGKHARKLTREHGLDAREAAEEFYKLSVDCGLSPDTAASIRTSVLAAGHGSR